MQSLDIFTNNNWLNVSFLIKNKNIIEQPCAFQYHFYAQPKIYLRKHVCNICGVSNVRPNLNPEMTRPKQKVKLMKKKKNEGYNLNSRSLWWRRMERGGVKEEAARRVLSLQKSMSHSTAISKRCTLHKKCCTLHIILNSLHIKLCRQKLKKRFKCIILRGNKCLKIREWSYQSKFEEIKFKFPMVYFNNQ